MRLKDIPKREQNAITARIESAIDKYGLEQVRTIWNRYITTKRQQARLKKDIETAETELKKLKRKSR